METGKIFSTPIPAGKSRIAAPNPGARANPLSIAEINLKRAELGTETRKLYKDSKSLLQGQTFQYKILFEMWDAEIKQAGFWGNYILETIDRILLAETLEHPRKEIIGLQERLTDLNSDYLGLTFFYLDHWKEKCCLADGDKIGEQIRARAEKLNPVLQTAWFTAFPPQTPGYCALISLGAKKYLELILEDKVKIEMITGSFVADPLQMTHWWLLLGNRPDNCRYYLSFTDGQFPLKAALGKIYVPPERENFYDRYKAGGYDFVTFKMLTNNQPLKKALLNETGMLLREKISEKDFAARLMKDEADQLRKFMGALENKFGGI